MPWIRLIAIVVTMQAALPVEAPAQTARAGGEEQAKELLQGYRRYHAGCNHCHGPDGLGSSIGPSLVEARYDRQDFRAIIRDGRTGPSGVMKGFGGDPNVMDHIDAIFAYIDARARGALPRGRPPKPDK